LEEDAGKLIHSGGESLIDFNRSGVALIEMVTEPVFHSVDEVIKFLKEVQLIARYCEISNADMEKGSMRLEANISLSTDGDLPDYKVELKNINSFKFLEKAINAEIKRQSEALDNGEKLVQETRGYDEVKQTTFSQRVKSDSHDYKYFPEADLPPIRLSNKDIKILSEQIPELPEQKRERFAKDYQISTDFINILVQDLVRANYFEECCRLNNNYKLIADMMINKKLDEKYPEPAGLVKEIVEMSKIEYANGTVTQEAIDMVLSNNPGIVEEYKNGKVNVIGYFIGQVQKELKGKGEIKMITEMLTKGLQK
jgi:aspartyl-tRNA(Asn)/glutamyl-tRNA(Gln) amidotransferase subunit B